MFVLDRRTMSRFFGGDDDLASCWEQEKERGWLVPILTKREFGDNKTKLQNGYWPYFCGSKTVEKTMKSGERKNWVSIRWTVKQSEQRGAHLELPLPVVQRTDLSGLKPTRDAVKVERMIACERKRIWLVQLEEWSNHASAQRSRAQLTCAPCNVAVRWSRLRTLTLNTGVHDVVSADLFVAETEREDHK